MDNNTKILADFYKRRTIFDEYLKRKNINLCTCPSCGYPTISMKGNFDWCLICHWEDDGQDDVDADEVKGGPNGKLSLTESRLAIGKELQELAQNLHGVLNTSPEEVLEVIKMGEEWYRSLSNRRINQVQYRKGVVTILPAEEEIDWRTQITHKLVKS